MASPLKTAEALPLPLAPELQAAGVKRISLGPALYTNAMTALFAYTPYAGQRWGGTIGGMYRFTEIYTNFGF